MNDLVAVFHALQQSDAPALLLLAWVLVEIRRLRAIVRILPCRTTPAPPAAGSGCPEVNP